MNERNILAKLNNEFIVNMVKCFSDRKYLYLVMDLLLGGDFRFHICVCKKFSEKKIQFFAGCIILGLEYLYKNKILHRDIKPENIVFDEMGYLRITDFGISRYATGDNYKETSGTPGYMSPEVLCHQNHSFEGDYFALGVILYECIIGKVLLIETLYR